MEAKRIPRCRAAALAWTLLLAPAVAALQDEDPAARLVRDAELQATIRVAVHAAGEDEQRAALELLTERAVEAPEELALQLFLYSDRSGSTRDAMAFGSLARILRLSDQEILRALVPLLETRDAVLRRSLAGVLAEFEGAEPDRAPSLAAYRPFLDAPLRAGQPLPAGLVRHLYDVAPGSALLLLSRAHELPREELRPLLWAEHLVADVLWKQRHGFLPPERVEPEAARELAALAAHPRWWVRLYAAAILRDHAGLRDADLIERLAADDHALVRETVAPLVVGGEKR